MDQILKRILTFKIRKRRRYKTNTNIYVVFEQSPDRYQIETLSMGGLSFFYTDNGRKIEAGSYVLAVIVNNMSRLTDIPFKTASDVDVGEVLFQKKRIKRQSVQFERLNRNQKNSLKQIIQNYAER